MLSGWFKTRLPSQFTAFRRYARCSGADQRAPPSFMAFGGVVHCRREQVHCRIHRRGRPRCRRSVRPLHGCRGPGPIRVPDHLHIHRGNHSTAVHASSNAPQIAPAVYRSGHYLVLQFRGQCEKPHQGAVACLRVRRNFAIDSSTGVDRFDVSSRNTRKVCPPVEYGCGGVRDAPWADGYGRDLMMMAAASHNPCSSQKPGMRSYCARILRPAMEGAPILRTGFLRARENGREKSFYRLYQHTRRSSGTIAGSALQHQGYEMHARAGAGAYEYAFLVDGHKVVADPGATFYKTDGFGSRNAVLYAESNGQNTF